MCPIRRPPPPAPPQPNLAIARVRPLNKVTEVGNSRLRLGEVKRLGSGLRHPPSAPRSQKTPRPSGRADAFATVRLRKRATARRSAPPQRSRPERRCCARTAAARAAPPQSGGQRRQNPGGALRKRAAFAGPEECWNRPGPGCRRARPRASHSCRTGQKIENSLLNSLFSGKQPFFPFSPQAE